MALTKQTIVDRIEIDRDGVMSIRRATEIYDDGELVGSKYHREVIEPGDVVSNQPTPITTVTTVVWTPAVIAAYAVKKEARNAGLPKPAMDKVDE